MVVPTIQHAFSAGEWSPELFGRSDTERYKRAASTLRNMWPSYRGGAYSRAGTRFIGRCKQAPSSPNAPRLIPFQFSVTQGYALEFGDNYMRPIFAGGYVTEPALAITGATQADPCAISVAGTPFANGDWVGISGVSGMTQLNGQTYIVTGAASGSFTLVDPFTDAALDATGFSAYVAGGAAARLFTLVTPYAAADLEFLKFTQSADVMSLTHPDYPPFDLARIANDDWTLTQTDFSATIAAPTGASAATSSAGAVQYQYVVTAVDATTGSESVASNIATVNSVDISTTAGTITVSWTGVAAAASYNVYLAPTVIGGGAVPVGSQFGFIGRAFGTQFADTNITPDFTKAPPNHQDPFAISTVIGVTLTGTRTGADTTTTVTVASSGGTGFRGIPIVVGGSVTGIIVEDGGQNYTDGDALVFGGAGSGGSGVVIVGPADGTFPGTVAYFQQRRWYAATLNQPDTYFASKPDDFTNFDTSTPTVDDDAIIGTPWAQQINGIQFMLAMPFGLVMFTGNGSWQLSGGDQATPVTPSRQIAVPQAAVGCSPIVPPIPINNEILFVQSKSSVVRDLVYNFWMNIYSGTDITVEAAHLFENRQILEWAWAEEPNKLLWAVRDDGILLCLTWLKEQETHAWSRHDTQGLFKSVCVTSEGTSQPGSGVPPVAVTAMLAFTLQPASPDCQLTLPDFQVSALDSLGDVLPGFVGNITITIGANPGMATLSGTTTVAAIAGTATFTGLALSAFGVGYTLVASGAGISAATSLPFDYVNAAFAACFTANDSTGETILSRDPFGITLNTAPMGLIMLWWKRNAAAINPIFGGDVGAGLAYNSVNYQLADFDLFGAASAQIYNSSWSQDSGDNDWHQDIISWNTSTQTFQWLRDGALRTPVSESWFSTDPVDYTLASRWSFNGTFGDFAPNQFHFSDFLFSVSATTFFDLTDPSSVAKLRTLAGKPVDISGDPAVNGSDPLVFFHGDYTDYQINLGTCGAFTVVGDPIAPSADTPWP